MEWLHCTFHRPFLDSAVLVAICFAITGVTEMSHADDRVFQWKELPSLPDPEGFAGAFAGTHDDMLIVAGGANFPDKMPWEGGRKVWYDRVFVLKSPNHTWTEIGKLPRPLGYGVSISTTSGVVCIGGSDAIQHYTECFLIKFNNNTVNTVSLPPLPMPCANACGGLLDGTLYVAGGLGSPTATNTLKTFWSLDLDDSSAQWQELDPWPGPARMLSTLAVQDGALFLCSGADLKRGADGKAVREYLRDAYRYQPSLGWTKIADLPRAAVASPTPAPVLIPSTFLILSGDDGTLVDFQPPERHPGFPKSNLMYHTMTNTWSIAGEAPVGHVTTTAVRWRDQYVIPSGEIRPGKRSPSVWSFGVR